MCHQYHQFQLASRLQRMVSMELQTIINCLVLAVPSAVVAMLPAMTRSYVANDTAPKTWKWQMMKCILLQTDTPRTITKRRKGCLAGWMNKGEAKVVQSRIYFLLFITIRRRGLGTSQHVP